MVATFLFIFIVSAILYPIPVKAGIFDWLLGAKPSSAESFVSNTQSQTYEKPENSQTVRLLQAAVNPDPNPSKGSVDTPLVSGEALLNESGPAGSLADIASSTYPGQISIYQVRKGDTIAQVAKMFGVSVNTIKWANDIDAKGTIKEGDTLTILPISGIQYTVKKGDTIASIAKKYKADIDEILSFNELESASSLAIGDTILIPDAEVTTVVATKSSAKTTTTSNPLRGAKGIPEYEGYYLRPITGGRISQGLHGYNGIDFAAPLGTPVYAAASGKVIIAKTGGYNGGYGNYVVILHGNGTQTLYGHLQSVMVSVGDNVDQSEQIGKLGNTGKSTGPHVHFEVRGAVNPFGK